MTYRAQALIKTGKYYDAAHDCRRAIKLKPEFIKAYIHLGENQVKCCIIYSGKGSICSILLLGGQYLGNRNKPNTVIYVVVIQSNSLQFPILSFWKKQILPLFSAMGWKMQISFIPWWSISKMGLMVKFWNFWSKMDEIDFQIESCNYC